MSEARSSFTQSSFLGGEWSPNAQGRIDDPFYKQALSSSINGQTVEEGAWTRRIGTMQYGQTLGGQDGVLREFSLPDGRTAAIEVTFDPAAQQSYIRVWAPNYG